MPIFESDSKIQREQNTTATSVRNQPRSMGTHPHLCTFTHMQTHTTWGLTSVKFLILVLSLAAQHQQSWLLFWYRLYQTLCLPNTEDSSTHNLFSVNLQLNLSNIAPHGGVGRLGGLSFSFAHGKGGKAGGLKWLRTGSGNRIHVPSPTTHTCDPFTVSYASCLYVWSSWETPWQSSF